MKCLYFVNCYPSQIIVFMCKDSKDNSFLMANISISLNGFYRNISNLFVRKFNNLCINLKKFLGLSVMLLLVLMSNHVGKQTIMQNSSKNGSLFGALVNDV